MNTRALDKLKEHFPATGDVSERMHGAHIAALDWAALRVMEPPAVEHIREAYQMGTERELHFFMVDDLPLGNAILLRRGQPYQWREKETLRDVLYDPEHLPAVEHAPLSELDRWRLEWLRFLVPTARFLESDWSEGRRPDPETKVEAGRAMMTADLPFDVMELSYWRERHTALLPDLNNPTPEDRTRTPDDLEPPPADGDWIKWARDWRAVHAWMPLPEDRPATVVACAHKLLRTGIGDAAAVRYWYEELT